MGFSNETRGLRINGTDFVYMIEGAYGVVFVDRAKRRVRKVYRSSPEGDHVRAVFQSEVDAYALAAKSPAVAGLIPSNFCICVEQRITDGDGRDVTDEFFPDLAFETDYVAGYFCKIGTIDNSEAERVQRLFRKAGIDHTSDMSVILDHDNAVLKAIDFAVREIVPMHHESQS